MLEQLFITVLNMSLTGALIILGVLIARLCLKKAPRIFSYALWAVPLFRLLCPFSFSAGFSLLGLFSDAPTGSQLSYIPDDIGYMHKPQVQLPLPAASEIVNEILPPATPAASMNPMQFWLFLGSWIWILGMALLLGFGLFSLLRFRRKLKNAQHDRDSIYLTEGLPMPFVMGFFRPRIYLPSGLSEEEKPYILLHEKIHIRRKDHLLRILAFLTLCLHWFNPLVYAAYILSGKDMEMSCDEAVIRKYGSSIKKEYSASLLSFATGHRFPLSTPLAFGESDTGARIKNALRYRKPTIIVTCAAIVLCAVVGFALLANPKSKSSDSIPKIPDEAVVSGEPALKEMVPEGAVSSEPSPITLKRGTYDVIVRTLSKEDRRIDTYVWWEYQEQEGIEDLSDLPALTFSEDCLFRVNYQMDTIHYELVSFDTFAALIPNGDSWLNNPCSLTFEDGLVVDAALKSAWNTNGITACQKISDTLYEDFLKIAGNDMLEKFYTKVDTLEVDIADSPGTETLEVYGGNIGDGVSGFVLVKDAYGSVVYSESAHAARAGWNNVYLTDWKGSPALLTLHIEDRDTYGEYRYEVFRLAEGPYLAPIAGSSFQFGDPYVYDDALFKEWAGNLTSCLEKSSLLLSTQDGELRTMGGNEADRYNYKTLKRNL